MIDEYYLILSIFVNFVKINRFHLKISNELHTSQKVNEVRILDEVDYWCQTWGMKLNVEKCKVMHFGKSNLKANYYMTDYSGNELYI